MSAVASRVETFTIKGEEDGVVVLRVEDGGDVRVRVTCCGNSAEVAIEASDLARLAEWAKERR